MGVDSCLQRVELLDCSGRVSHRLVLLIDGRVRIEFAYGRSAIVDPRTRCNLTPEVPVGPALLDRAAQLEPW